jgi:hypothetical protein
MYVAGSQKKTMPEDHRIPNLGEMIVAQVTRLVKEHGKLRPVQQTGERLH